MEQPPIAASGETVQMERQREFRRNEDLERLLKAINEILGPAEDQILERYSMPQYPVVFVVGAPRSGTTLMMQWMASSDRFAYPTNLLSRFYGAPHIGALIQQLLTAPEYNYNDEILDFSGEITFKSSLGKTQGALAPNEFWYFWRRFTPNTELVHLDAQSLSQVKGEKLASELAAIEAVFDKPLALKAHILELNIPFLSSVVERALFLFIKRHPFYNIQSLLESRTKFFGNRRAWYSVKPKEYDMLKDLDPIEQVAGQVYFTNQGIEEGLGQIDSSRGLVVGYEEFCAAPGRTFSQIGDKLGQQGYHLDMDYTGPEQFQSTNEARLARRDCDRIIDAYRRFSGEDLGV